VNAEDLAPLVEELETMQDPSARETARAVVHGVLALHREGLTRLLEILAHEKALTSVVARAMDADPLVTSLLELHELAPDRALVSPDRLVRRPVTEDAEERCDLCAAAIGARHEHLVDPTERTLRCTCQACATLFAGDSSTKLKRVPHRVERLVDFQLDDGRWDMLRIPTGIAFFCESSARGRVVARYPGPAGATESTLPLDAWSSVVGANPRLADLAPDIEALLVNRMGGVHRAWRVSIDECYALVGRLRTSWRGLGGGEEAEGEIARFFAALDAHGSGAHA
jgi:hypothetical protein